MMVAARKVIDSEALAIMALKKNIGPSFVTIANYLAWCLGRVITTGVGKSGLAAQRFAATLRAGGTAAFYLHPVEAIHGDVGALRHEDVLVVFSRSGESDEIKGFVRWALDNGLVVTGITERRESWLAQQATAVLATGEVSEACPLGLTATTSVTVAGVIGDALALTVQRHTTKEDFAGLHPAGNLGRRATTKVLDVMVTNVGIVRPTMSLVETLVVLARKRGTAAVQELEPGPLLGIVTAGDVARFIDANMAADNWVPETTASVIMSPYPKTTTVDVLVTDVITQMQEAGIMALPVVDPEYHLVGMIHLHDALRARVQ